MAETLRELVVALSLDSNDFSRNMRTIAQQIKEAESTFTLAGAGVDKFGSSLKGNEAKLDMLKSKLDMQKSAVEQYARALEAAEKKLRENSAIHSQYTQKLETAKAKHDQVAEKVAKAQEKYDRLAATLGTTNATTRTAGDELDRLKQELAASEQEIKKLEGQVASTSKTLQNNADQVSKLQTGYNNAVAAVRETEAAIRKTEAEIRRLSSAWTQAGAALTSFGNKAKAVSKELVTVGRSLTRYITTPVAALGAVAVKSAESYESAFAGVRKATNLTGEDAEKTYSTLSHRIEEMSTVTNASAEEIAGVVKAAGQLGIAVGENGDTIMSFSKVMLDLGVSSNMAAEEAAVSAARFFNIMNTAPESYNNYGAAVSHLGNSFATMESDIVEMSMRMAGAGKQVGLTEAEVLGFATALSSVGINAQAGGSAFSKALVKMELAVQGGGQALKDFAKVSNMSAAEFKALWNSDGGAAKAFSAFIAGLAHLDDEGKSAIVTLNDIGFNEIRLRDTTLRLTNATQLLTDTQVAAKQAWSSADIEGQNALTNAANKYYQTLSGRFTQLKNRALIFARTVGNDLVPSLNQLITFVTGIIDKFLAMDEGTRVTIERFAILAATVGPAILVIGKFIGAIGSSALTLGKFATWMGKITTATSGATGALGAFGAGSTLATAGVAALAVAVVAGTAAFLDYASGAKRARDEASRLNRTAQEWKDNPAETFYNNAGLSTFGLSSSEFQKSRTQAQRWVDDVTRIWSNGEKKTGETVANWTASLKSLTDDTRTELKSMQDAAKESGQKGLARELGKDIRTLDSIDRQVTSLLRKKANGKLTDKEKVKLENLIQQGDAIRIKYKLEPQDEQNSGYEQLRQNLNAEVARLQATGASQDQIVDTYGRAAAAAAQGYKVVNDQLAENYRTRYQEIQQIEDEGKRTEALAQLNAQYQSERKQAALEYAQILKDTYGPVLSAQNGSDQAEKLQKIVSILNQYQDSLSRGDQQGQADALQALNDLNLDESQLTEYFTTLTQIQSLMDGGLLTPEQVQELFPDAEINTTMTNLAAIQTALNGLGEDKNLEGLKTMIGEALPEEVQKILIGLDMTQAAQDWAAFADNPGAITTSAKISSLETASDDEAKKLVIGGLIGHLESIEDKVPEAEKPVIQSLIGYLQTLQENPSGITAPTIQGLLGYIQTVREQAAGAIKPTISGLQGYISTLQEQEGGAAKPTIEGVIAYLSAVQEQEGGASKPTVSGLLGYLSEIKDQAAEADKPAINSLIGYLTKVSEEEGGADTPAIAGLTGYLQTVLNGGGDVQAASLPAILGLVGYLDSVEKSEGYTGPDLSELDSLIAYISEYQNSPNVVMPTPPGVMLYATIGLNPIEQTALAAWKAANPIEASMQVKVGNVVGSVEDLFNKENVTFYEGGVQVKLSPAEVAKKVTLNDLVVVDEDGTLHVIITPELGSKESLATSEAKMNDKALPVFSSSAQHKVNSIVNAYHTLQQAQESYQAAVDAGDVDKQWFFSNEQPTALANLQTQLSSLSSEDIQAISLRISDLMAALNSGEGNEEEVAGWQAELENLKTVIEAIEPSQFNSTGENIMAGIGEGMVGYDYSGDAATVKESILSDINSALGIESPATTMKPTGANVAAGIGEGMTEADMSEHASLLASNLQQAAQIAFVPSLFRDPALTALRGLSLVMLTYSFAPTMASIAAKIRTNLSSHLTKQSFKTIGKNAMDGLKEGIKDGTAGVVEQIRKAARAAVQAAKAELVIESPSHVFRDEVGVMAMRGFAVGIQDETERQARAVRNASRYLTNEAISGADSAIVSTDNRRTYNQTSTLQVTQNIYADHTSYAEQQRQAAKQFRDIARRI